MRQTVDLEDRLRALSSDAIWPPTPDLRPAVLDRIVRATTVEERRWRPPAVRGRRDRMALAMVLAATLLIVIAGIAAGLRLGVPGLDILWGRPTVGPGSDLLPVTELALVPGAAVPLGEARTMEPPRILVPTTLPTPETAFVDESGDVQVISLAWRAPPGMPGIDGSDLGLVLMAAPGRIEAPFLTKVLGEGSTIEPLSVGADPGWWISGASHELLVVGTDGGVDVMRSRFAGDTLVFARDGSVYRLESVLGRDRTLEIATSLR